MVKKGVDEKNIVIYGESLGTGVATHLSQNKEFAGVILETPFTSMIDAAKKYPQYGFEKHMGYGTKVHMAALNEYGPCPLHRRSFAPVRKAEKWAWVHFNNAI